MSRRLLLLSVFLILSQTIAFADAIKPACFRLEGITMSCAGGGGGETCQESCEDKFPGYRDACQGQVVGTICEGKVKCYGSKCCTTCKDVEATTCGSFTICQGTPQQQTCTGTKPPMDCSTIGYCVKITEQPGTIMKSGSCIGSYTPGFQCGSPISAGDGCVCTCQRDEGSKSCYGVGNDKCTSCSCGTTQTQNPNYINYCKNQQGTCATREPVPAQRSGQCGCACPDPGGSFGTPLCSSCSHEDYQCIVPP